MDTEETLQREKGKREKEIERERERERERETKREHGEAETPPPFHLCHLYTTERESKQTMRNGSLFH